MENTRNYTAKISDMDAGLLIKSMYDIGFGHNVKDWDTLEQLEKPHLIKKIIYMAQNNIKTDIKIEIEDIKFYCHKIILEAYSEYFKKYDGPRHLKVCDLHVTAEAFSLVYQWMMLEKPKIERISVIELLNAATYFEVKELQNQIWTRIGHESMSEDAAYFLYCEACLHDMPCLKLIMLSRINKFFLTFVSTLDFVALNALDLKLLLQSNYIGPNLEIEVFYALIRWINFDWNERHNYLLQLMKLIRFGLISPLQLVALLKGQHCIEIHRIVRQPEIQSMLKDGIAYAAATYQFGQKTEEFYEFIKQYKLTVPVERAWLYDSKCSYHHKSKCINMQTVTYEQFLNYLQELKQRPKYYWKLLEAKHSRFIYCCDSKSATETFSSFKSDASSM